MPDPEHGCVGASSRRPYAFTAAYDAGSRTSTVRLSGDIDCAAAAAVRTWLLTSQAVQTGSHLVVDLTDVRFLDVVGLNLILALRRAGGSRNADFRLDGLHGQPRRLLDVAAAAGTIPAL